MTTLTFAKVTEFRHYIAHLDPAGEREGMKKGLPVTVVAE